MTADDDVCFLPATEMAALVRAGKISARELLDAHLDRIDRFNPAVNAVVTLDVDGARAAADAADAALAAGEDVGPLHGLPVAHKDTHATGGMRTTWGSPLHADTVPLRDELVVARLKAAGAVRVGKTNVPEFAAGSHTFNPLFGATHNPYRHGLSAGGSSGGAAAALAAGFVPVAEGSDMGGSLRNPAAFCNVVGLRPTPGRVPSWPTPIGLVAAVGAGADGPHGRRRRAAALGPRRPGPPGADRPRRRPGVRSPAPLPERLDGLRVAWAPDLGGRVTVDPTIVSVLAASVPVFEGLGASVEDDCPDLSGADDVFGTLRAWLFEATFGDLARRHPDKVKDSIRWNAELGAKLTGPDLARAEIAHTKLYERMVAFFEQLRRPARAHDPGAAVPGRDRVPDRDRRRPPGQLPGVDALLHRHHGDRLPRAVGARRLHRGRPARRTADHRRAARRPPRARGGPRLRAGDAVRPPSSASLSGSTAL